MTADILSSSAARVQRALQEVGLESTVRELPQSTRTAAEAAETLGCQVSQIAKTVVFMTEASREPILAILCGSSRVDEHMLAQKLGQKIKKASPDFVLESTGFAIGGVPPLGHRVKPRTFFDPALLGFDAVWAAAGTPHAVCSLSPQELLKATGAELLPPT